MGTGDDAGDNTAWAAQFSIPRSGTRYVDASDTVDFYKFVNTRFDRITAEITPSGYFTVKIYDVGENLVATGTGSVSYTDTSGGYNYVAVERLSDSYTDYTLTIKSSETIVKGTDNDLTAPAHNDMGTGADAYDEATYASSISAGSGTGYFDSNDVYDYYKVTASSGQTITATLTTPSTASCTLEILNSELSGTYTDVAGGQTEDLSMTVTASGDHYILVSRASGLGTYSLTVSVGGSTDTTDMGSGGDAGGTNGTAATISAGSGTGYMNGTDPTDVFKIYVTSGQNISATLTPPSGADFNLTLYEDSVTRSTSSLGENLADNVSDTAVLSGYRYIWVTYVSGSGNYTLNVLISEPMTSENVVAPEETSATNVAAVVSIENLAANVWDVITIAENGVSSINVQTEQSIAVSFEDNQLIKTIAVSTNTAIDNVIVQAQKISTKPQSVSEPSTAVPGVVVSHYLDIANIEFKVEKSWLTDNNIDPDTVKLLRYTTTWTELPTTYVSEDATYRYYTATTPGFSTFAVVGATLPTSQLPPLYVVVVAAVVMLVVTLVLIWRKMATGPKTLKTG